MFEYTKHVFDQTVEDVKRITNAVQLATEIIYIAYLVYAIAVSAGIVAVNVALLIISAIYFAFTLVMNEREAGKNDKKFKGSVKKAYKISKYIIQIPTLVVAIITLSTVESDRVTFSLLFTVLMILGYVMSVLLSVLTAVVESRAKRFMVAIEADVEPIMKVINGIKKLKGDKIEPREHDQTKEKIRSELDLVISKSRQEKKEKETADRLKRKEDRKEETKEVIRNVKEKLKQKLASLTSDKQESLPPPSEVISEEPEETKENELSTK